jgi:hypothetical protein
LTDKNTNDDSVLISEKRSYDIDNNDLQNFVQQIDDDQQNNDQEEGK